MEIIVGILVWYAIGLFAGCQYLHKNCELFPLLASERFGRHVRRAYIQALFGPCALVANALMLDGTIFTSPIWPGGEKHRKYAEQARLLWS